MAVLGHHKSVIVSRIRSHEKALRRSLCEVCFLEEAIMGVVTAEHCRAKAEECQALAAQVTGPIAKQVLELTAGDWINMAEQIEAERHKLADSTAAADDGGSS